MAQEFSLADLQPERYREFEQILDSKRLSHAYLFTGGFGSEAMALVLAQSRFCEVARDTWPCGECRSCRLIRERSFSDVKWIAPEGQTIKTQTIREMTQEFSQSGYEGEAQVFIIQEAQRLHVNAANSLLKFIEEPQSDSYVIFLTSDLEGILPTIRSRTQIFHFTKHRSYIKNYFEQHGLLPSQARLLTEVVSDESQLEAFATDKRYVELIELVQRFVGKIEGSTAFLEADRLSARVMDKKEQELVFQLLVLLLREQLPQAAMLDWTQKVYHAQAMWRANVSFQNVLEYMVIT